MLLQPLPSALLCLVCAAPTLPQPALFEPAQAPAYAKRVLAKRASPGSSFAVGDTFYVAARLLHVRNSPRARADGPWDPNLSVGRNQRGNVIALPNRNWARVLFMSEDVGFEGYVSQWYLAKEKTKSAK